MGNHNIRPGKPNPKFPLTAHLNGQWYITRRIGGVKRFFYFGPWKHDRDGSAAHAAYLMVAADIHAGRMPNAPTVAASQISAGQLVEQWISHCQRRAESGEIGWREFGDLRLACLFHFLDAVGEATPAESLEAPRRLPGGVIMTPLELFRCFLDKRMKAHAFNRNITKVRAMLRWSNRQAKILTAAVHENDALKKKKKRIARKQQRERDGLVGVPIFEPWECAEIVLRAAEVSAGGGAVLAIVLLMLNSGWGNSQVASLPTAIAMKAMKNGLLDWVRVKNEEITQVPLWPVTIWAMREYLDARPQHKSESDAGVFFITKYGNRWVREDVIRDDAGMIANINPNDEIGKAVEKIQLAAGIKKSRRGAYSFRHTFATVASETLDKDAVRRVMGHSFEGMDPHYLRKISVERLQKIVSFVGHRLVGSVAVADSLNDVESVALPLRPEPVESAEKSAS